MRSTTTLDRGVRSRLVERLFRGDDPYAGMNLDANRVDLQGWEGSLHPWLSDAVDELRPDIIVEVGVWKGASTLFMAERLRASTCDGVVLAVDTWLGSSEHRTNPDWYEGLRVEEGRPTIQKTFVANVLSRDLRDHVLPLPLDSLNAAELFKTSGLSADVIHIDAGHDYRSVTEDLEAWWPLLRTGGVLIGDDYYNNGAVWPEVKKAFDAFTSRRRLSFELNTPKIRIRKPKRTLPFWRR